ncbi:hypothetical protein NP493_1603g00004 [Ridgeia piscesae]|uniref:Uncharacterized protein n=1 Tax=Ridgeia piscesae TaxID=27915 RepID=A0AAD9JXB7_RIDPI|nr:hypothetical protein NP493_1603g00004 [Ridgeia piscesae]
MLWDHNFGLQVNIHVVNNKSAIITLHATEQLQLRYLCLGLFKNTFVNICCLLPPSVYKCSSYYCSVGYLNKHFKTMTRLQCHQCDSGIVCQLPTV